MCHGRDFGIYFYLVISLPCIRTITRPYIVLQSKNNSKIGSTYSLP